MMGTEDDFLDQETPEQEPEQELEGTRRASAKADPFAEFMGRMKAPQKAPVDVIKKTEGDPVAASAREYFKAFRQEGLIAIDDGSEARAFASAVRKASGGFDAVGLMRQIRNGE